VVVEPTHGFLSDHYHPLKKKLRLSEANHSSTSIAAAGISAHEVGHALQHAQGYLPLMFRSILVPVTTVGSWIGQIAMLAGFLFTFGFQTTFGQTLLIIAILGYATVFLFTLVTLPVEFNASSRALRVLMTEGILDEDELVEARSVLRAAAMTYVASAVQILLILLYLFMLLGGSRD
jgi:Zn-dependent membrane protease YugP